MHTYRPLLALVAALAAAVIPSAALAGDGPPSTPGPGQIAETLCKQEAATIGSTAFIAKYGSNGLGACVQTKLPGLQTALGPQGQGGGDGKGDGSGGGAPAQGQKPDPAARLAGLVCQQEAQSLGRQAFAAKYGQTEAMGACVTQHLDDAQAAIAACKVSGDAQKACLAGKLGLQPPKQGGDGRGSGQQASLASLAGQVAGQLCQQEGQAIGKQAFQAKYGQTEPYGNCIRQHVPDVQAAFAACPGSGDAEKACVAQKLGLKPPTGNGAGRGDGNGSGQAGTNGGGQPPAAALRMVELALCQKEAQSIGRDAFAAKYGQHEPFGACADQQASAAQALVAQCASASVGLGDCVRQKLGLTAPATAAGQQQPPPPGKDGQPPPPPK